LKLENQVRPPSRVFGEPAFLADGAASRNSRPNEVTEGREALRTAGLETGATILDDV